MRRHSPSEKGYNSGPKGKGKKPSYILADSKMTRREERRKEEGGKTPRRRSKKVKQESKGKQRRLKYDEQRGDLT